VGADGGPGGELLASLGGELTEQPGDGGHLRQGDDQLIRAQPRRGLRAGHFEEVEGLGDVLVRGVVHGSHSLIDSGT
jgi:hypothetical protein